MSIQPFRISRVPLVAGVLTSVKAPMPVRNISIGNQTAGNLEIHTAPSGEEYIVLMAGFERLIPLATMSHPVTNSCEFWLKAAVNGEATILWF